MKAAVPRTTPCLVAAIESVGELLVSSVVESSDNAFAKPKSSIFTTPSAVTLILAGFKSR
jgi:hypothetical protein